MHRAGLGAAILLALALLGWLALRDDPGVAPAAGPRDGEAVPDAAPTLLGGTSAPRAKEPPRDTATAAEAGRRTEPHGVALDIRMPDNTPAEYAMIRHARFRANLSAATPVRWTRAAPFVRLPKGASIVRAYRKVDGVMYESPSVSVDATTKANVGNEQLVLSAIAVRGRIVLTEGLVALGARVLAVAFEDGAAPPIHDPSYRIESRVRPHAEVLDGHSRYEFRNLAKGRYVLVLLLRGDPRPAGSVEVVVTGQPIEQDLRAEVDIEGYLPVLVKDPLGEHLTEGLSFRFDPIDPRFITHRKRATALQREDGVLFVRPPPFVTKTNQPVTLRGAPLLLTVTSQRYGRREHRITLPRRDPLLVSFLWPVRLKVRIEGLPKPLRYASHVALWERKHDPRGRMTYNRMPAGRPHDKGFCVFHPLQPGRYLAKLFLMSSARRDEDGKVQPGLAPITLDHYDFEVTPRTDEVMLRVPTLHSVRVTGVADDEGALALYRTQDDGASWHHSMVYRHSDYTLRLLVPGTYRLQSIQHQERVWTLEVPATTELRLDGGR